MPGHHTKLVIALLPYILNIQIQISPQTINFSDILQNWVVNYTCLVSRNFHFVTSYPYSTIFKCIKSNDIIQIVMTFGCNTSSRLQS